MILKLIDLKIVQYINLIVVQNILKKSIKNKIVLGILGININKKERNIKRKLKLIQKSQKYYQIRILKLFLKVKNINLVKIKLN
jgi:hypothetical protein